MKKILEWLKSFNFWQKKEKEINSKFQIGDCVMSMYKYELKENGDGVVVDVSINMINEIFYTIVFEDGSKAYCEEKTVVPSYYQQDFLEKIKERMI